MNAEVSVSVHLEPAERFDVIYDHATHRVRLLAVTFEPEGQRRVLMYGGRVYSDGRVAGNAKPLSGVTPPPAADAAIGFAAVSVAKAAGLVVLTAGVTE